MPTPRIYQTDMTRDELKTQALYPKIKCAIHDRAAPAYTVCRCIVEDGEPPAGVIQPTATTVGVIVCARNPHPKENWLLICADCAREKGYISAEPPAEQ